MAGALFFPGHRLGHERLDGLVYGRLGSLGLLALPRNLSFPFGRRVMTAAPGIFPTPRNDAGLGQREAAVPQPVCSTSTTRSPGHTGQWCILCGSL